jgi:predicted benzoate:H+ symporter BenE
VTQDRGVPAQAPSGYPAKPEPRFTVSALRAGIPNAVRGFIGWLGPFGVTIAGIFLLMVGVSVGDKPNIMISVVGGLMLLSSLEMSAERAKAKETERWAKLIADMISGEGSTTFEVKHTFASIRPELDELVATEVAQAIEARRAETAKTGSVEDESAVASGDAPEGQGQ